MTETQVFNEAKNKLHRDGFVFWFPPRTWGERDVLGVFDFVAAKGRRVILVQLTTIQHVSDRKKKIQNFYDLNGCGPLPNAFIWAYSKKNEKFKVVKV